MNKEINLNKGFVCLVDSSDYEEISKFKWHVDKDGYAVRNILVNNKMKKVRMHRQIMGLVPGDKMEIDHINGDKADNRRSNLRICSRKENCRNRGIKKSNTSGFKGVSFSAPHKKWRAYINGDDGRTNLGLFDTPEAAHEAYCKAALATHGEFARFQ